MVSGVFFTVLIMVVSNWPVSPALLVQLPVAAFSLVVMAMLCLRCRVKRPLGEPRFLRLTYHFYGILAVAMVTLTSNGAQLATGIPSVSSGGSTTEGRQSERNRFTLQLD